LLLMPGFAQTASHSFSRDKIIINDKFRKEMLTT
jgi:hypothetical protein